MTENEYQLRHEIAIKQSKKDYFFHLHLPSRLVTKLIPVEKGLLKKI